MKYLRGAEVGSHPRPTSVGVAGFGGTGPIVAAIRTIAGEAIDHAVVDTGGFRFAKLLDYRDPRFLPGGRSTWTCPACSRSATDPLWLAGEGGEPALHHRRLPCGRPEGSSHLLQR